MEEADALCSRIGIMAGGTLRAIGAQLHLKNKYGYGYRLTVIFESENFNDGFIFDIICNDAVVIDQIGNTIYYDLPKDGIDITNVFSLMNTLKFERTYQIRDWALSHTSLEEVFVNVSTDDQLGTKSRSESDVSLRSATRTRGHTPPHPVGDETIDL